MATFTEQFSYPNEAAFLAAGWSQDSTGGPITDVGFFGIDMVIYADLDTAQPNAARHYKRTLPGNWAGSLSWLDITPTFAFSAADDDDKVAMAAQIKVGTASMDNSVWITVQQDYDRSEDPQFTVQVAYQTFIDGSPVMSDSVTLDDSDGVYDLLLTANGYISGVIQINGDSVLVVPMPSVSYEGWDTVKIGYIAARVDGGSNEVYTGMGWNQLQMQYTEPTLSRPYYTPNLSGNFKQQKTVFKPR